MRAYLSLIKKEIIESLRTHKILVSFILFAFIGLISPLTAKLTPLIIESISTEGMEIKVTNPVEIDSWIQFFKNINQIGMVGLALLFSAQIVNEFQNGTLINLLTKGLDRKAVILSKISVSIIIWILSYVLCFFISFIYTGYFFTNSYSFKRLVYAWMMPLIFGFFILSIEILANVITSNIISSLVILVTSIGVQFILNFIEGVKKYLPISLLIKPDKLIKGVETFKNYLIPMTFTIMISIILIVLSVIIFNRKEFS